MTILEWMSKKTDLPMDRAHGVPSDIYDRRSEVSKNETNERPTSSSLSRESADEDGRTVIGHNVVIGLVLAICDQPGTNLHLHTAKHTLANNIKMQCNSCKLSSHLKRKKQRKPSKGTNEFLGVQMTADVDEVLAVRHLAAQQQLPHLNIALETQKCVP